MTCVASAIHFEITFGKECSNARLAFSFSHTQGNRQCRHSFHKLIIHAIIVFLADCGTLTIANGQFTATSGTTFGQTAALTCSTGYTFAGDATLTCTDSGVWNGSANCTIVGK